MHAYEARVARLFGPDYQAFGFWKARVGLYAILKALGIGPGDEVLLPGYTCVVVPNTVAYLGAKPIYVDIDDSCYNISPACIEERLTSRTRVVIGQHTYGIPAGLDALETIADQHGVCLIEDCAHVLLGTTHKGRLLGSRGLAAFFSFQWSKPYTTGLGGMVVTRDANLQERLGRVQEEFQKPPLLKEIQLHLQYQLYRQFYRPKFHWMSQSALHALSRVGVCVGSSNSTELRGVKPRDVCWRMTEFQKQAGLAESRDLRSNSAHRRLLTNHYLTSLSRWGWPVEEYFGSEELTLLRFPLRVREKAALLEESRRERIEIGTWFNAPLHPLPLSQHRLIGYRPGCCPNAELAAREVVNLPLHNRVAWNDAERIVNLIHVRALPAIRQRATLVRT